eukprot:184156_1
MASFFILVSLLMVSANATPEYLSVPLSTTSQSNLDAFGAMIANNMAAYFSGDINWRDYREKDGGWSNKCIVSIDNLEPFDNYAQFVNLIHRLKDFVKSMEVSDDPIVVTVGDDDESVLINYCVDMEINGNIPGISNPSFHTCFAVTKHLNDELEVVAYDLSSDGTAVYLFLYIMRSTTTKQPVQEALVKLFQDPESSIVIHIYILFFVITLLIGISIGCLVNRCSKTKQLNCSSYASL